MASARAARPALVREASGRILQPLAGAGRTLASGCTAFTRACTLEPAHATSASVLTVALPHAAVAEV